MNEKNNWLENGIYRNGSLYEAMSEDEAPNFKRLRRKKRIHRILLAVVVFFLIWNIQNLIRDEYAKTHLQTASSYKSLYKDLKKTKRTVRYLANIPVNLSAGSNLGSLMSQGGNNAAPKGVSTGSAANNTSNEYSSTNLRTKNVAEADSVTTDGSYLYYVATCKNDEVDIYQYKIILVKVQGTEQTRVSEINLLPHIATDMLNYDKPQIYVQGSTLCVVGTGKNTKGTPRAIVFFYDISDKTAPALKKKIIQSGAYLTSRLKDGVLYFLSQFYIDYDDIDKGVNEDLWVPCVDGKKIPSHNIYMQRGLYAPGMTVLSAIDFTNGIKITDTAAVRGCDSEVYVSAKNIYLLNPLLPRIGDSTNKTGITKLQYKDGKIQGKAHNTINGCLQDAFAVDEYKGNLRLFLNVNHYASSFQITQNEHSFFGYTLSYDSKRKRIFSETPDSMDNVVYLLDSNLKELGSIEHLAKDEEIYSARMCGDYGYFVTYKTTDPLFCVDLSDEKHLKVLDSIKLSGYSDYLHNYTDNLLLGLGFIEEDSGSTLKLAMYDTSNHGKLKELHCTYLNEIASDAFVNYKELYIEPELNLFGFDVVDSDNIYNLYQYDKEKGFINLLTCSKKDIDSSSFEANARGVRIGNYFYIISLNNSFKHPVMCYDLNALR